MAKKTKDAAASTKTAAKVKAPTDPATTRNLLRLLNALALLLAIAAFLLQLFAVLTHHWKWQVTDLRQLLSPGYHYAQPNVYQDSRLDQNYGLYSRDVKVYASSDEQLDVLASTRFPRLDDGDANLHHCLSQTSTLRGAFLTCAKRIAPPAQCHCRRYLYWNFVIFFEVVALVLLGIVVFLLALLNTQFQAILKLAAAGLALLAFLFLVVGLLLIVTHLKRETRSLADTYPHIYQRLASKLGSGQNQYPAQQHNSNVVRRVVRRRRSSEIYRAYPLSSGQYPYNDTHFQEYSEQARAWVYKPYSSIVVPVPYAPLSQQREGAYVQNSRRNTTAAPAYNPYGPVVGYNDVYDKTQAGIGWSTVLSILATILSLLLPLLLIFSWLTGKKLAPNTKTVTTTTVKSEYVAVPTDVPQEIVGARPISTEYSSQRPIGDAVVKSRGIQQGPYDAYAGQPEPVIVRDVIIRDDQPIVQTTTEQSRPVNVETSQTTQRS